MSLNQLIRAETHQSYLQRGFRQAKGESPTKFKDYERLPTGVFPIDYMMAGGIPLNVLTQF